MGALKFHVCPVYTYSTSKGTSKSHLFLPTLHSLHLLHQTVSDLGFRNHKGILVNDPVIDEIFS